MDKFVFAVTAAIIYVVLTFALILMGPHATQVIAMLSLLTAAAGQWAAQDDNYWMASIYLSYAAFGLVAVALLTFVFT